MLVFDYKKKNNKKQFSPQNLIINNKFILYINNFYNS